MSLVENIKTALDELRMQMLGLQVLFGFQFQGLFQPGFDSLSDSARMFDAAGLMLMIIALAILIGIPCQHRMVEEGESTPRLFSAARLAANIALGPLAAGFGCDILVAAVPHFGMRFATALAMCTVGVAAFGWYGLPYLVRGDIAMQRSSPMHESQTPLHDKIEQMLTEARVILPGTQALLGFQMIVMLTSAFSELSRASQYIHVAALLANASAMILLICPAAVHRMSFGGRYEPRMHTVGSALLTMALAPLSVSISLDFYVALDRLFDTPNVATAGALLAFILMLFHWYLLPLYIRRRLKARS